MLGGQGTYTYSWTADGQEVSRSDKFTVGDDLLGKTITVTVTDAEGNTATDTTEAVKGEAIISEVTLDNITPAVGDKITASAFDEEGNDVSAFCTWQWFRVTKEGNVVKISNATKQSYTVGAIDTAAVLYCEAEDANGNLLKSNESSVMKPTNVTQVNVNGMTGQRPGDKDKFVAVAGDELKVELVPYTATLDAGYQWYRSGAAIKGATESTYVPTTADVGLTLSVKVTIPSTAGYGFSTDATTTNANLDIGTVATGTDYALAATVTLDDEVCWDLSNSKPVLDNTKPAVGDTLTVKVPFDKNGDGDEEDTGDFLDLTSDTKDATVAWYRGSIAAKNLVGEKASYDVTKEDSGKALYVVVTGAEGREFIGSCQATTDDANKTVMSTEISRETTKATSTADMDEGTMKKGAKLYASTKDNSGAGVKDENLTFQWYRGGSAIDGATSSSYTIGDDDLEKFDGAVGNKVTYRVVVNGKDGYTGTAKDTIDVIGADSATTRETKEDISVKRGDYYLHGGNIVNAGDELKLAASFDNSLDAMNIVWWYTAKGDGSDVEQFTGKTFTVPATAGKEAKLAVTVTLKADAATGPWGALELADCTTDAPTAGTDPAKTTAYAAEKTLNADVNRVVWAGEITGATPWDTLTTTNKTATLNGAKSLDSIVVTYKVADREVTAPEVGATMTATVTPNLAGLKYTWTAGGDERSSDAEGDATEDETGENANKYTITKEDINKKIKVTVKAGEGTSTYANASTNYETEEVGVSSRQISELKVLKYETATTKGTATDTWYVSNADYKFLNDKKDFVNKKSVSVISTDEIYIMVALDSDGELVDADNASYNLYNFKSGVEKKVGSAQIFTAGGYYEKGDIAHFEVAPNQIGYTGSAATYNLSSAVADGGAAPVIPETITLTIEPDETAAEDNADEALLTVAVGASVPFTASVDGVDVGVNPSIKWYTGDGKLVKTGVTYNPKALTDGTVFYAEMVVSGTTYTSDAWTVEARVWEAEPASVTVTEETSGEAATAASGFTFTDQFGAEKTLTAITNKDLTKAGTSTGNATGKISVDTDGIVTLTMTDGDTAGAETLTYSDTTNDLVWTVTGNARQNGEMPATVIWTVTVSQAE